MNIKKGLKIVGKAINDHQRGILTTFSILGLAWTIYETATATKKIMNDISDDMTNKEKAKIVVKDSIRPAISAAVTSAVIIRNHAVSTKQINEGIIAINALSEIRKFDELYREKVREKIGEKEERKLRDDVAIDRASELSIRNRLNEFVYDTGHGNTLFRDGFGGFLYLSSWEHNLKGYEKWFSSVRNGQEEFSNFNELYYYLDIPLRTQAGEVMGISSFHQLTVNDLHKTYDRDVDPDRPAATLYIDDEYISCEKEVF